MGVVYSAPVRTSGKNMADQEESKRITISAEFRPVASTVVSALALA